MPAARDEHKARTWPGSGCILLLTSVAICGRPQWMGKWIAMRRSPACRD